MSYTPQDQQIEEVQRNLINAIDNFNGVVDARIKSRDWSAKYMDSLHQLRKELLDVQVKLLNL